ncbi:hypothetical protein TNCV_715471 [Trichonephila clavipes]|nr:hypothetical protein TNCV_715471 [Trichonephila clavipes]
MFALCPRPKKKISERIRRNLKMAVKQNLKSSMFEIIQEFTDSGWGVVCSSPVPLKTLLVERADAQMPFRFFAVEVRRSDACSRVVFITGPWFKFVKCITNSPNAALI